MIMSVDFLRTQSPIGGGGGGFLADPFLDLNGAITTPALPKSTKLDSTCVSNGALAGAIIGTLILSAFIGFLTWLTYIRPKFQELHYKLLYDNRRVPNVRHSPPSIIPNRRSSNRNPQINDDHSVAELPLDVTDYKFGTFPFRQSQISNPNGYSNRPDWLNRISSSFRSVNIDQDSELIDIELLEPTFGGLNFSITGNMRAGIFVKDILHKGHMKSNQLKTGDRIMALTVCFESIVYEDALTILSYASPYPVILRIQRPIHHMKMHVTTEKRPTTVNLSNKVKWRDDFEHYDNDSSRSYIQPNRPPPPPTAAVILPSPLPTPKMPSSPQIRSSVRKSSTQPRQNNKTTTKGTKIKTSSNSVPATNKRSNTDLKRQRSKVNIPRANLPTITPSKPPMIIPTPPMSTNRKPVKSVTDAVMSYLHYKGVGGEHSTDVLHHSETTMMPYYDSPYDYYYGGQVSQYQYLHQSHLNKNNNNSLSADTLTAVTPNLATSVYTLHLSSIKASLPVPRRCQRRRLSSPAIMSTALMNETALDNRHERNISIENIDTYV